MSASASGLLSAHKLPARFQATKTEYKITGKERKSEGASCFRQSQKVPDKRKARQMKRAFKVKSRTNGEKMRLEIKIPRQKMAGMLTVLLIFSLING